MHNENFAMTWDSAKKHDYADFLLPLVLMLVDYIAILCAEKLSFELRNMLVPMGGALQLSWLVFFVIFPFIYIIFFHFRGLYTKRRQHWKTIKEIFQTNAYIAVTLVLFMYIEQIAANISRLYIFFLWMFSFFIIVIFRTVLAMLLKRYNLLLTPILIMGAGKMTTVILQKLHNDIGLLYNFVGFLADDTIDDKIVHTLPCLGKFSDAKKVITAMNVRNILVIAPNLGECSIQDLVYSLQPLVKEIAFIPDMGKIPLATLDIVSFVDGHIVAFKIRNNLAIWYNKVFKFCFDKVCTFIGMILLFPLFVFIGLWISFDSPGPIIYRHVRVGKNGKNFYCYKFRTMCVDADAELQKLLRHNFQIRNEWKKDFKLKADPRITKSGIFLRKTSLDELPQVFNVLKGEMSLVGPRPIVSEEIERYGKYIADYYSVRPGITGIWQTSGRNDISYDERVQMDTWYVRNWNIWFDMVLLWRTFEVVWGRKGAY